MHETLYTIGHSNHPIEKFVQLLAKHRISAVADVRSRPYSRMNPQFNRENLHVALKARGLAYVFLGRELGARTEDRNCYVGGKVQYDRLARTSLFQEGLERITDGVRTHRIALMCAEKDPTTCHRMILVCHELRQSLLQIAHIGADGTLELNAEAEARLVRATGLPEVDLFTSSIETVEEAYRRQAERIAWVESASDYPDELSTVANAESSSL